LPQQAHLNVDETGHKDSGKAMWTWCFRASLYTLFQIDPYRSADVLIEVLGEEFDGGPTAVTASAPTAATCASVTWCCSSAWRT
jgi:hypothetical protein